MPLRPKMGSDYEEGAERVREGEGGREGGREGRARKPRLSETL